MENTPTYEIEKYSNVIAQFTANPNYFLHKLYSIYLFNPHITENAEKHEDDSFSKKSQMILSSKNDLAVILLSQTHEIIDKINSGGDKVQKIEFPEELLSNQVSGKRKRNALKLFYDSKICTIFMESGVTYDILAGVTGFLLEINKSILENPNQILLERAGYFAIMKVWIDRSTDDYDFNKPYYKRLGDNVGLVL